MIKRYRSLQIFLNVKDSLNTPIHTYNLMTIKLPIDKLPLFCNTCMDCLILTNTNTFVSLNLQACTFVLKYELAVFLLKSHRIQLFYFGKMQEANEALLFIVTSRCDVGWRLQLSHC